MIETALNPGIDAVVVAPAVHFNRNAGRFRDPGQCALDTDFTSDKKACSAGTATRTQR